MFCVITPVFDGCVESVSLLIQDLQRQTYTQFQHILISNGPSSIKELVEKVNDSRMLYREYPKEDTSKVPKLIENLGKRRNYCMKGFKAKRYFFFDADLKIIDDDFFNKINQVNDKADIIISKIVCNGMAYPIMPLKKGHIDLANYSVSKKIADNYTYPMEYESKTDIAFDWRFFNKIKNEGLYFSEILYAHKNGHNNYKTISSMYLDWANNRL